jgi:anoctamin-10
MEWSSLQSLLKLIIFLGIDKRKEKEAYQRYEWFGHLMQLRNNALIFFSIIFLQLSFELAYAHLYEVIESDVMR